MKNIFVSAIGLGISTFWGPQAIAESRDREVLFLMGETVEKVETEIARNYEGSGYAGEGSAYLWVKNWPEGSGPVNEIIDLKKLKSDPDKPSVVFFALPTATDFSEALHEDRLDSSEVKVMNLTIENSEITGFEVDIQLVRDTTVECALGFHSVKGNQDGVEIVFKEQHEESGDCLNRDWEAKAASSNSSLQCKRGKGTNRRALGSI